MNRREFLITTSAAALASGIALVSTSVELVAQPVSTQILPDGEPATPMLGFNGSTPGPVLRACQGEHAQGEVIKRARNALQMRWQMVVGEQGFGVVFVHCAAS